MKSRTNKIFKRFLTGGLLLSSMFFGLEAKGQQGFEWAITSGGDGANYGTSVTSDGAGNAYYCGYFEDEIDLDEAGGGFVLTTPNANTDMFVSKLDPNGNFLWGRHFSSTGRNRAESITIDDNDNVYVTGYFEGTVDFDPGAGTSELTSMTDRDVFILKLNTDGDFLWVKHFGGSSFALGLDINFSKLDNVLVSGIFAGNFTFDPSGQNIAINAANGIDGFAFRLNQSGNLMDYIKTESTGNAFNYAMDEDTDGNIYIGGHYTGDLDLGGSFQYTATDANTDPYIIKYDNTLNPEWVTIGAGTGEGVVRGLRVGTDNNVYFGGYYDGDLDLTANNGVFGVANIDQEDIYVGSLNNLGEMNWLHGIGGIETDYLLGLELDDLNSVYTTGYIRNTVDFDPSAGNFDLTSGGGNNTYVWKLNSAGDFKSAVLFEAQFGYNLSVASNWDIFISGYYSGTKDFDPSGATFSMTSSGTGRAAYVSKLSQTCTDVITNVDALSTLICPGVVDSTKVYVDGTLNDANDWAWYEGSCGGTYLGSGDSLTVRPSTTTKYYVRGEGACTSQPCDSVLVFVDNDGPVMSVTTPITVNTIPGSCYYASDSLTPPTATDTCAIDTVYNDAVLLLTGTTTVTWTAVDVNGNISQETQEVTVIDNEDPEIDAPTDVTVSADVNCEATGVALGTPISVDNCAVNNVSNDAPATFPLGVTVVTWTVEDDAGNTTTDTQNVTVEDDTDPTIVGLPADISVNNDPGVCEATVSWTAPTPDDNCPGSSIAQTAGDPSGSIFPVGVTTIEYTATDAEGNETTESFTITVTDNEDPTITAPADITVSADNFCAANPALGNATIGDNCGVASVTNDAPASFTVGITTVTWTVTDVNGIINTDTQDVEVIDDSDPTIVDLPADITANVDPGSCSALINWTAPTVDDNCPAPSIFQSNGLASGSLFPVGTSEIEYTATDAAGNTVIESFTITVVDNEDPTITAPADVTVSADNNCQATGVTLGTPTTGDNCGVDTVTNDAPSIYSLGITTVTWTVTDNAGNIETATQDVIVEDDQDPTIIAPSDITLTADSNCEATVADLGTPVTQDNCSIASVTNDAPAIYTVGTTTVTWTIEDGSGNISTDTQDIIVIDDTDPVIDNLPTDSILPNDAGVCEAVFSWTEPTVSDNCTGATISQTGGIANGDPFPVGVNIVEYTATDGSGNEVTATFTVTVTDDELPTIVPAADTTIAANNFCVAVNVDLDVPAVSDNCGVQSVTNDAPILYELGTTTVTWTVTDDNGNTEVATQLVTVADTTAPTISAPLPVTAYVDDSCEVTGVDLGEPITNDNCAVDTIYNDAPAMFNTGSYNVMWYAEDASGNIDSTIQVVTILDTIAPTPIVMDTTLTLSPEGPITLYGEDIDMGSYDNCGFDRLILEQELFDCDDIGINTIGVTALDVNGNVYDTFIVVTVEESGIDLDFDMIDDACDDDVNTTEVIVPSGFTPNGDGINDMLIIPGLDGYTNIHLTIFNRYGNLVYESEQYENDWDGTSSKNGMELPDGTYFFVLDLDEGERQNGYIHINRTH
ncbi:MAG: HYR domain-containing protein [Brumimicrobium sp.]